MSRIGFFPNSNFINIVWAGVTPKRKITELKHRIDDGLMDLFQRDKRFDPHITLGRVKDIKDKIKFKESLDLEIEGTFKVNNFKLIKSKLGKNGAEYETLEEFA